MTQALINVGTFPNDATGDPAQTAFIKINNNFSQLFGTSSGVIFGPPPTPPGGTPVTIQGASPLNAPALVVNSGNPGTLNVPTQSILGATTAGASNGLFIQAGVGNAADRALDVLNQASTIRLFGVFGDGSFSLGHSGSGGVIGGSAAGNVIINTAVSGTALSVFGTIVSSTSVAPIVPTTTQVFLNGANSASFGWVNSANVANSRIFDSFVDGAGTLHLRAVNDAFSSATDWCTVVRTGIVINTVSFGGGGTVTIPSPVTGTALTVNGSATGNTVAASITGSAGNLFLSHALQVAAPPTTGLSNGMRILAGTNASDSILVLTDAAQTVNHWVFFGDGGLVGQNATGGSKGAGTINCTGLFVNGVAVTVP